MFTTILRIGPLALLQNLLLSIAIVVNSTQTLPQCLAYTLAQIGSAIFLLEMYISLSILKNNSRLRINHLKQRINENNIIFILRLTWDNLNIILLTLILYSLLTIDAITLIRVSASSDDSNSKQKCNFFSFLVCAYVELVQENTLEENDVMMMWVLYAVVIILITSLTYFSCKSYYHFYSYIQRHRKILKRSGGLKECLIESRRFEANEMIQANHRVNNMSECAICLNNLIEEQATQQQSIIKLTCKHVFHEKCIQDWLSVKDNCPFRCQIV